MEGRSSFAQLDLGPLSLGYSFDIFRCGLDVLANLLF